MTNQMARVRRKKEDKERERMDFSSILFAVDSAIRFVLFALIWALFGFLFSSL